MWSKIEHSLVGNACSHDPRRCEKCLSRLLPDPQILLKYQRFEFPSHFRRFGLATGSIKFDTCFKLDITRFCTSQSMINDEIVSLSKILKPDHHLFVYANTPTSLDLLKLFAPNVWIWIFLDHPGSYFDDSEASHLHFAAICTQTGELAKSFTEVRRETIGDTMKRLKDCQLVTNLPDSCYFGFG